MSFDLAKFAQAHDELTPAHAPPLSSDVRQRAHNLGSINLRKGQKATTFEATLATGTPVNRNSYFEVLDFTGANLNRAKPSLPLLHQHDQSELAGHVSDVRVVGNGLRGSVHLSETQLGRDMGELVRDGSLRTLSIGYQISELDPVDEIDGLPAYRASKWELLEASLVSIPADPNATIGRGLRTRDLGLQHEISKEQRDQLRDAELRQYCRAYLFKPGGGGIFAAELTPIFEAPLMRVFAEEIERIRGLEHYESSDCNTLNRYILQIRSYKDSKTNISSGHF